MCMPGGGGGGGMFGGGNPLGPQTQELESSGYRRVSLPPWAEAAAPELYATGEKIASRPYPLYPYARIAPFSADEEAGFALTRMNVGAWEPYLNAGISEVMSGSAPVGEADIAAYYNPYQSFVTDELWRQNQQRKIQEDAAMARSGSYLNEDRRGVIDALRDDQTLRTVGLSFQQAFDEALGQANIERNRDLAAASQYLGVAPDVAAMGYTDAAALQEIGQQQRDLEQRNLALAYSDFMEQFGYPQDQVNWLMSLLQGIPMGRTEYSQGTEEVAAENQMGQMLGLAATVAPLIMMSSRDSKHIEGPAETILDRVRQLPIKTWRYKPEISGDNNRHIGPMAEDFHALFNVGDGKTIHVGDLASIALAAIQDLAARLDVVEREVAYG